MGNREVWKVVPVGEMSKQDMDFARRQGIIVDPDFSAGNNEDRDVNFNGRNEKNNSWQDLGSPDVLPAADIRSSWRRNVERRSGNVHDLK